jgi:hypothetical protein
MSEDRKAADQALMERVESALLESTRDLKGYTAREVNAQLAQMESRFERRLTDVEAELKGINIKLVAMRDELHQSLSDQTTKLAVVALSVAAVLAAVFFVMFRFWR